ncbi:MAG: spermidine synthase [Myxococcota bacterium]
MAPFAVREPPVVVDRQPGPLGEWVLRRRRLPDGHVYEMIANGAFLMDSREHGSEEALARLGVEGLVADPPEVLVGGLGFGYTLRAVLDAGAGPVTVAELAPAVVQWVRGPLRHLAGAPLTDPRVTVHVGDVAALTAGADARWDAILLDVDNGPEFLVHESNAGLYTPEGLRRMHRALSPGGRLALWSSSPSPRFHAALRAVFGDARARPLPVHREGHRFEYVVYVADREPGPCP